MKKANKTSKKQNQSIHSLCSEIMREYFKNSPDHEVTSSTDPSHNFIVDGQKCRVNAHNIIPKDKTKFKAGDAVVIEVATDQHTMIDAGYDCILYMDPSDKTKFYMADVKSVYEAIQTKMGKKRADGKINPHFFEYTRKDVLENTGFCVGITVAAFLNIEGVTLFNL